MKTLLCLLMIVFIGYPACARATFDLQGTVGSVTLCIPLEYFKSKQSPANRNTVEHCCYLSSRRDILLQDAERFRLNDCQISKTCYELWINSG